MTTDKRQRTKSDYWWGVLLVGLPLVSLLAANLPPNLRFWNEILSREAVTPGLDSAYRYPFSQTLGNDANAKVALQRELVFYQERVSRDPQSGLNLALLAAAYLKMARATGEGNWYLQAEQTAKRSLASLPFSNEGALLVLARVAEARHDFPTALSLAEKVGKGNEDALAMQVTANLAMGKVEKARQGAETLVNRIANIKTLTLRSLVYQAMGKDALVLRDFQSAIAAEEPGEIATSAKTRTLLGRFYFQRGQLQQAEALYREALRIFPRYPLALLHLAELETRLGKYSEAERHYAEVLSSSKSASTVYDHAVDRGMARLKQLQGDAKAAKEWLEKAEALLRSSTATGHGNGSFGHRRELALLLLDRGGSRDIAEAVSLMREEVKIRRDAQTLDTFAQTLLRAGDAKGARQAIQEALKSGIRDARILYRAGACEKALGNHAKARSYFQQARQIDPTLDEKALQSLGFSIDVFY